MNIVDSCEDAYRTQDLQKKADYVTEEILSMMFFSDIHDNPIIPYRSPNMIEEARKKYPFNKPLGIDTSECGVEDFVNQLIGHIKAYYTADVIENIQRPISVDPATELEQLQFYEENSHLRFAQRYDDILSSETFYTLEQMRKEQFDLQDNHQLTEEEKESKLHNTFIHDKMMFDAFNTALHHTSKRKEEV